MAVSDYAKETLNEFGAPLTNFLGNIQQKTTDFFKGQKSDYQDYLGRYSGAIKGQTQLGDMYSRIGKELNMPALYQNANNINTQMANLPGTYNAASRGFDVNANQLNRIVGTKQAALAPAQQAANQALQNAQQQMNTQIGFEQEQQKKELDPYKAEQQLLTEYQARQATGFSKANEAELTGYIKKLEAGIQLSEGEKTRANQLAMAELDYKAKIYSADKQLEGQRAMALASLGSKF